MERALGENVGDLIGALSRKGIPLPYEVGTFIALDVARTVLRQPRRVTSTSVHIDKLGRIAVASTRSGEDPQLAGDVITLLGQLLVASAPGVPERLLKLVESVPGGSLRLQQLHDELEATLVPLNRDAATRALARIVREAFKVSHGRPLDSEEIPEAEVDSALDAILGVDREEAEALRESSVVAMPSPVPVPRYIMQATVRGVTELDEHGRALTDLDLRSQKGRAAGRAGGLWQRPGLRWLGLSLVAVAAALVLAVVSFDRPRDRYRASAASTRDVQPAPAPSPAAASPEPATVVAPETPDVRPAVAAPLGQVRLSTVPAGAQVLLRVVQTAVPLTVQRHVAHEFIAVSPASGHAVRALLPAGAAFVERPDGLPAYELDLRVEPDAVPGDDEAAELGPSRLRADALGRFQGAVGVVNIRMEEGSLLYKFLGVTPSPALGPLPTDQETELLLYRRGYRPKTVRLSRHRWQAAAVEEGSGMPSLDLTLNLEPKA